MLNIYVYVLDTLADWELGYIVAELNSGRFFKKDAPCVSLTTVSYSDEPITTMGGITIVPHCLIDDIVMEKTSTLLLPGADTWSRPEHEAIIEKAAGLLSVGATVCAICGATTALANVGLLDNRPHTSNGPGFLEMFSPGYKGQGFYVDKLSVADGNLITAACTGALLWTRDIIEHVGVFEASTMEAWYKYFSTGESDHFYALMQTLETEDEG